MAAAAASPFASVAKRLQGKVAIITGGASGIGGATARLFSRHGAKVLIADVQTKLGQSLAKEIQSETGEPVSYIHCDVTQETDVENTVNAAISTHGKLDIMYNNAGITGKYNTSILSLEREDFLKVVDINLYGALLGAKYAAKVMIPQKKGNILFTASVSALTVGGAPFPYSSSKHGVIGLTKNLAAELGKYGIRANCISPAGIPTPMAAQVAGVDIKTVQEFSMAVATLKGVKVDTNDIAEAALYLGSDESKFVTGLNLVVDGGFALGHANTGLEDNKS